MIISGCVSLDVQVLDRVLLHTGGESWWGTLTGRLKTQRLAGRRRELVRASCMHGPGVGRSRQ